MTERGKFAHNNNEEHARLVVKKVMQESYMADRIDRKNPISKKERKIIILAKPKQNAKGNPRGINN